MFDDTMDWIVEQLFWIAFAFIVVTFAYCLRELIEGRQEGWNIARLILGVICAGYAQRCIKDKWEHDERKN